MVDHADFYLAIFRSDRWMRRHMDVEGHWPEPGKAAIDPSDVSVDRAEIHSRRMEFQCVLSEPAASNSRSRLEDAFHLEADVPLGVLPPSHNGSEETLVH